MIITEKIKVNVSSVILNHYRNNGYICNVKDEIIVNVNHLPKQSTTKILVKCDVCGCEKNIQYRKYINNFNNKNMYTCCPICSQEKTKILLIEKYGDENYNNLEKRKITCKELYNDENYKNPEKTKITNLERYGVECSMKNEDVKNKRKNSYIEKYGVEHPMKCEDIVIKSVEKSKKTKIEKGYQLPDDMIEPYKLYRRISDNYLRKIRKSILQIWDGYDYYDGEYIKENVNLEPYHKCYPTLDHKISVYYGYKNNIPLEIVNSEKNICITKRSINSSKGSTCS